MNKKVAKRIAVLSALLLLSATGMTEGMAGTQTTTFNVTATVPAVCKVSANNLPFGTYTPGSGAVTGNSTIDVNCTNSTPFTVALSEGDSASYTQRYMEDTASGDSADLLDYQLYTTSGLTSVWGDGGSSDGTSTVAGTGSGMGTPSAVAETVYGQIPDSATNQTAIPGSYQDTITVTVSY